MPTLTPTCGRPRATIGTVRIFCRRGTHFRAIKVLDAQGRPYWRPYAVHLWESHHGPVPPGRRVLHEDGDTLHDDPANLVSACHLCNTRKADRTPEEWSA